MQPYCYIRLLHMNPKVACKTSRVYWCRARHIEKNIFTWYYFYLFWCMFIGVSEDKAWFYRFSLKAPSVIYCSWGITRTTGEIKKHLYHVITQISWRKWCFRNPEWGLWWLILHVAVALHIEIIDVRFSVCALVLSETLMLQNLLICFWLFLFKDWVLS